MMAAELRLDGRLRIDTPRGGEGLIALDDQRESLMESVQRHLDLTALGSYRRQVETRLRPLRLLLQDALPGLLRLRKAPFCELVLAQVRQRL